MHMVLVVLVVDNGADPIVQVHSVGLLGQVGPVVQVDVEHRCSIVVNLVAVQDTGHDCKDLVDHPDYFANHLKKKNNLRSFHVNNKTGCKSYRRVDSSDHTAMADTAGDPL